MLTNMIEYITFIRSRGIGLLGVAKPDVGYCPGLVRECEISQCGG